MAEFTRVAAKGPVLGGRRWKVLMGYLAVTDTARCRRHELCS